MHILIKNARKTTQIHIQTTTKYAPMQSCDFETFAFAIVGRDAR